MLKIGFPIAGDWGALYCQGYGPPDEDCRDKSSNNVYCQVKVPVWKYSPIKKENCSLDDSRAKCPSEFKNI